MKQICLPLQQSTLTKEVTIGSNICISTCTSSLDNLGIDKNKDKVEDEDKDEDEDEDKDEDEE